MASLKWIIKNHGADSWGEAVLGNEYATLEIIDAEGYNNGCTKKPRKGKPVVMTLNDDSTNKEICSITVEAIDINETALEMLQSHNLI